MGKKIVGGGREGREGIIGAQNLCTFVGSIRALRKGSEVLKTGIRGRCGH